jgi:hypothetical protein
VTHPTLSPNDKFAGDLGVAGWYTPAIERSADVNLELESLRADHFHHRGELGIDFGGQGFVQALPAKTAPVVDKDRT